MQITFSYDLPLYLQQTLDLFLLHLSVSDKPCINICMSYLVALKYELACHFFFLLHLPNAPWSNSNSGNYTKPAPVILLNLSCVIVMRFLHDVPPLCLHALHPCCRHVSRASGHRRLQMFSSLRRPTTLCSIRHRGWRYGP